MEFVFAVISLISESRCSDPDISIFECYCYTKIYSIFFIKVYCFFFRMKSRKTLGKNESGAESSILDGLKRKVKQISGSREKKRSSKKDCITGEEQ